MLYELPIKYNIYLMWKNEKVALLNISIFDGNLFVDGIEKIYNRNLLPVKEKVQNEDYFNEIQRWFFSRNIPDGRINFTKTMNQLGGLASCYSVRIYGIQNVCSLLSYGINMTDKYWINPVKNIEFTTGISESKLEHKILKQKNYNSVNPFKNIILKDIGNLMIEYIPDNKYYPNNYYSPDICTNGCLIKRWIYKNENLYLEKRLSKQHLNDIIECFDILLKIDKSLVPDYFIDSKNDDDFIIQTKCLTNNDTELYSIFDLVMNNKKRNLNDDNIEGIIKQTLNNISVNDFLIKKIFNILSSYIEQYNKNHERKITLEDIDYSNIGLIKDTNTGNFVDIKIYSSLYFKGI